MSSVVVYVPPPMQKRAFYMMLARAKELSERGEAVTVAYCSQRAGTCSSNLSGSALVCAACRFSSRKSLSASGLPFVALGTDDTSTDELPVLNYDDAADIMVGVHSCLVTVLRVMTADLNRVPGLREIKRRYFTSSVRLLQAFRDLVASDATRVEVLNGRFACMKVALMAAAENDVTYNTLDFNLSGQPMVFEAFTPHDRIAVQKRILRNEANPDVAATYFEARRSSVFNRYAAGHQYFSPPEAADGYRRRVSFFLSSQDECESLGPSWRTPFKDNPGVIRAAAEAFPDYFFCVRFHPNQASIIGDVTGPFQDLQLKNVCMYLPTDDVNSYELMEWSDVVVTFASTVAVESCWMGKPVIELGPSYFDHLNISYTPSDTIGFLDLLGQDLQARDAAPAARFANYELNDFDEFQYYSDDDPSRYEAHGITRWGSIAAKPAKEFNNLVTWLLQRKSRQALGPDNRAA